MSATTALSAAPPLAAGEEMTAATAVVERQEEEQKVTEETKKEAAGEVEADETTDVSDDDTVVAEEVPPSGEDLRPIAEQAHEQARQAAAQRVRQSGALPPGLRERLAALVASGGQVGGDGQALVSIDEAIRAVAESLPSSLRIGGEMNRPEHPGGESFFSGRSAEEITDQQAEEIARGQLAAERIVARAAGARRSGLAKAMQTISHTEARGAETGRRICFSVPPCLCGSFHSLSTYEFLISNHQGVTLCLISPPATPRDFRRQSSRTMRKSPGAAGMARTRSRRGRSR